MTDTTAQITYTLVLHDRRYNSGPFLLPVLQTITMATRKTEGEKERNMEESQMTGPAA